MQTRHPSPSGTHAGLIGSTHSGTSFRALFTILLTARQREAIVLRYYAQLSGAETASVMHCAEGTVRALTYQAISSLRAHIEEGVHHV